LDGADLLSCAFLVAGPIFLDLLLVLKDLVVVNDIFNDKTTRIANSLDNVIGNATIVINDILEFAGRNILKKLPGQRQ